MGHGRNRPEVADWTYHEDPFLALLASYGIEALSILHSRLLSDNPKVREKHHRLLRHIAGIHGSDCLLRSWEQSSTEEQARIFLALSAGSTNP